MRRNSQVQPQTGEARLQPMESGGDNQGTATSQGRDVMSDVYPDNTTHFLCGCRYSMMRGLGQNLYFQGMGVVLEGLYIMTWGGLTR